MKLNIALLFIFVFLASSNVIAFWSGSGNAEYLTESGDTSLEVAASGDGAFKMRTGKFKNNETRQEKWSHEDPNIHQFTRTMKEWKEYNASTIVDASTNFTLDSRFWTVKAFQSLQSLIIQNRMANEDTHVLLVIGGQSTAKTTTTNSITKQAVFIPKSGTGTRVRTHITTVYDPELAKKDDNPVLCSLFYNDKQLNVNKKDLTPEELRKSYEDLSQSIRSNDGFSLGTCQVTIRVPYPTFSLTVVDHPGLSIVAKDKTENITVESLQKHFPEEGASNGFLLITHGMEMDIDQAAYQIESICKRIAYVPKGDLFFAITKVNTMRNENVAKQWANRLIASKLTSLTPLQLLEYIESVMKNHSNCKLPEYTRFFFVASSSLQETEYNKEKNMWPNFLESQKSNELEMISVLTDAKFWATYGIELKSMEAREHSAFHSRISTDNLVAALLERQFRGANKMALNRLSEVERYLADASKQLILHRKAKRGDLGYLIVDFLQDVVTNFHQFGVGQHSHGEFHDIFNELLQEEMIGWKLDEIHEIFKGRNNQVVPIVGSFPPDHRLDDSIDVDKEILERVEAADAKLFTVHMLLPRDKAEYVIRSSAVKIHDINPNKFLSRLSGGPGVASQSASEALFAQLSDDFDELLGHNGGNRWVSQRVALDFLLHTQTVVDVMARMSKYKSLVAPQEKMKRERHILNLIDNFAKFSKFQPSGESILQNEQFLVERDREESNVMPVETYNVTDVFNETATEEKMDDTPHGDIVRVLIAKYYDDIFEKMKQRLDPLSKSLAKTYPEFLVAKLNFAPLMIHQDYKFVNEYKENFPNSLYVQAFLNTSQDTNNLNQGNLPLFSKVNTGNSDPIRSLHRLGEISFEQKIDLKTGLVTLNDGPDVPINMQVKNRLLPKEIKSLNFCLRRYETAGLFVIEYDVLRAMTSCQHSYYQEDKQDSHRTDLISRLASLMLGYKYPFTQKDRAEYAPWLHPATITPFLYRILVSGDERILPNEKIIIQHSPVVRYMISKYYEEKQMGVVYSNIVFHVKELYNMLIESRHVEYDSKIIKIMSRYRYHANWDALYNQKLKNLETEEKTWKHIKDELNSYIGFLKQHGEKLVGNHDLPGDIAKLKPT